MDYADNRVNNCPSYIIFFPPTDITVRFCRKGRMVGGNWTHTGFVLQAREETKKTPKNKKKFGKVTETVIRRGQSSHTGS